MPQNKPKHSDIDKLVAEYSDQRLDQEADRQGVPRDFVRKIAGAESSGRPDIINGMTRSRTGAIGKMQLMPGTAKELGVDPEDLDGNIRGGVSYAGKMLKEFGGDLTKAAAAYNAGPGAVRKYGGVPPYAETQAYVKKVATPAAPESDIDKLVKEFQQGQQAPAPDAAPIVPAKPFTRPPKPGPIKTLSRGPVVTPMQRQAQDAAANPFATSQGAAGFQQQAQQAYERTSGLGQGRPQGLMAAANQFKQSALKGLARIPQGISEGLQMPVSDAERRLAQTLGPSAQEDIRRREGGQLRAITAATEPVVKKIEQAYPVDQADQSWMTQKIPAAAGSLVPMLAAAALGRGVGARSAVTSALSGAAQSTGEVSDRLNKAGVQGPQRDLSAAMAIGTGATEALGLGRVLDKIGAKRAILGRIGNVAEDVAQEYGQEYLGDVNAKLVGQYDKNASLSPISPNKLEAAALGGILGGAMQGAGAAISRRPGAPLATPPIQPEPQQPMTRVDPLGVDARGRITGGRTPIRPDAPQQTRVTRIPTGQEYAKLTQPEPQVVPTAPTQAIPPAAAPEAAPTTGPRLAGEVAGIRVMAENEVATPSQRRQVQSFVLKNADGSPQTVRAVVPQGMKASEAKRALQMELTRAEKAAPQAPAQEGTEPLTPTSPRNKAISRGREIEQQARAEADAALQEGRIDDARAALKRRLAALQDTRNNVGRGTPGGTAVRAQLGEQIFRTQEELRGLNQQARTQGRTPRAAAQPRPVVENAPTRDLTEPLTPDAPQTARVEPPTDPEMVAPNRPTPRTEPLAAAPPKRERIQYRTQDGPASVELDADLATRWKDADGRVESARARGGNATNVSFERQRARAEIAEAQADRDARRNVDLTKKAEVDSRGDRIIRLNDDLAKEWADAKKRNQQGLEKELRLLEGNGGNKKQEARIRGVYNKKWTEIRDSIERRQADRDTQSGWKEAPVASGKERVRYIEGKEQRAREIDLDKDLAAQWREQEESAKGNRSLGRGYDRLGQRKAILDEQARRDRAGEITDEPTNRLPGAEYAGGEVRREATGPMEGQPVETAARQMRPPAPPRPAGGRNVERGPNQYGPTTMSAAFPRSRRGLVVEGRRVQGEIEAGRGDKGEFGKLAQSMFKSTSGDVAHGQDSFFHDSDVKGALGLTRDAEQGEVRAALKSELARVMGVKSEEVSLTQVPPQAWQNWAGMKQLGGMAKAKLQAAIQKYQKPILDELQKTVTPTDSEPSRPVSADRGSEAKAPSDYQRFRDANAKAIAALNSVSAADAATPGGKRKFDAAADRLRKSAKQMGIDPSHANAIITDAMNAQMEAARRADAAPRPSEPTPAPRAEESPAPKAPDAPPAAETRPRAVSEAKAAPIATGDAGEAAPAKTTPKRAAAKKAAKAKPAAQEAAPIEDFGEVRKGRNFYAITLHGRENPHHVAAKSASGSRTQEATRRERTFSTESGARKFLEKLYRQAQREGTLPKRETLPEYGEVLAYPPDSKSANMRMIKTANGRRFYIDTEESLKTKAGGPSVDIEQIKRNMEAERAKQAAPAAVKESLTTESPAEQPPAGKIAGKIDGKDVTADEMAVYDALAKVEPRIGEGAAVSLTQARAEAGLSKEAFDKAALSLASKEVLALHATDFPQSLSPEGRAHLVQGKSEEYIAAALRTPGAKVERAGARAEVVAPKTEPVLPGLEKLREGYEREATERDQYASEWEEKRGTGRTPDNERLQAETARERARAIQEGRHSILTPTAEENAAVTAKSRTQKEKPNIGLTPAQTTYLQNKVGEVKPRLEADGSRAVTIRVPDDGQFTVRTPGEADKLMERIGKPIVSTKRPAKLAQPPTDANVPAELNEDRDIEGAFPVDRVEAMRWGGNHTSSKTWATDGHLAIRAESAPPKQREALLKPPKLDNRRALNVEGVESLIAKEVRNLTGEKGQPAQIAERAVIVRNDTNQYAIIKGERGNPAIVDAQKLRLIHDSVSYDEVRIASESPGSHPIGFFKGGELQALLMPMRIKGEEADNITRMATGGHEEAPSAKAKPARKPRVKGSVGKLDRDESGGTTLGFGFGALQGMGKLFSRDAAIPKDVDAWVDKISRGLHGSMDGASLDAFDNAVTRGEQAARNGDKAGWNKYRRQAEALLQAQPERDTNKLDTLRSPLSNLNFKGTYERRAGEMGKEISEMIRNAQVEIDRGADRNEVTRRLRRDAREYEQALRYNNLTGLAQMLKDHVDYLSRPEGAWDDVVRKARATQYNLKLRFNPRSTAVNLLQPFQTLWPHMSTADFARVSRRAASAEAKKRIDDIFGEETGLSAEEAKAGRKWDLFGKASAYNRRVGYLAGEMMADRLGMTGEAKDRLARDWAKKVEFDTSKYDAPPLFQGNAAGLLLQFKAFQVKNIERIIADAQNAPEGSITGKKARIGKMVFSQMAIGGLNSIPGSATLGGLVLVGAMAHALKGAGMSDEASEKAAEAFYYGLPALVGLDFSGSVGILDAPFGKTMAEKAVNYLGGPTGSTIVKLAEEGKTFFEAEDSARGKTAEEKQGNAVIRAAKTITPYTKTAIAGYSAIAGALGKRKGMTPDLPISGKPTPMTPTEAVGFGLMGTPVRQSKFYDEEDMPDWQRKLRSKITGQPVKGKAGKTAARPARPALPPPLARKPKGFGDL